MSEADYTAFSYLYRTLLVVLTGLLAFYSVKSFWRQVGEQYVAYVTTTIERKVAKTLVKQKEHLFQELHRIYRQKGHLEIIEFGSGSCENFRFYPRGSKVICVEPNIFFKDYAAENIAKHDHVSVKVVLGRAENMPAVEDASVDAVVCTLVLCCVADMDQVLSEVKRVLRPGGKFLYIEHVAADRGTWTYYAQHVLNPLWKVIFNNCHLARETGDVIKNAGFSSVNHQKKIMKSGPAVSGIKIFGVATK